MDTPSLNVLNKTDPKPGIEARHPVEYLTYRISILSRVIDRYMDRQTAKQFNLSLTECRVLCHLGLKKTGTVRGLSEEMHMYRPQVSRAMSNLINRNYVARALDPADGRSAIFSITSAGESIYRDLLDRARDGQKCAIDQIGADKYDALNEMVRSLIDAYDDEAT